MTECLKTHTFLRLPIQNWHFEITDSCEHRAPKNSRISPNSKVYMRLGGIRISSHRHQDTRKPDNILIEETRSRKICDETSAHTAMTCCRVIREDPTGSVGNKTNSSPASVCPSQHSHTYTIIQARVVCWWREIAVQPLASI